MVNVDLKLKNWKCLFIKYKRLVFEQYESLKTSNKSKILPMFSVKRTWNKGMAGHVFHRTQSQWTEISCLIASFHNKIDYVSTYLKLFTLEAGYSSPFIPLFTGEYNCFWHCPRGFSQPQKKSRSHFYLLLLFFPLSSCTCKSRGMSDYQKVRSNG